MHDRIRRLRHVVMLAVLVLFGTMNACGKSEPKSNGEKEDAGSRRSGVAPMPPAVEKTTPLFFVDRAHDAGITFRAETGSAEKMWIPESIGQGVMLFDYDNDGDLDIYFAMGGEFRQNPSKLHKNGLWRNDGDWKFTDVTEGSGLECGNWSVGVYAADFDADGYEDVYVTKFGRNAFFRNLGGTGKFADMTSTWGGDCPQYSTSAAFFDADQDGDLDLFVCNYVGFDFKNPPNKGLPCRWKELEVCCGPRGLDTATNVFYENVDGHLVDKTKEFGFADPPQGTYSLGCLATDLDVDGDVDVYVAVDSRPSLCFENLGNRRFKEVGHTWQVAVNAEGLEQAGMGCAAGDPNEDGFPDLFKTNFSHDTNTFYVNSGQPENMFFTDMTSTSGLGGEASYRFLSWATAFQDFNSDGALDIFVASGHVYPQAEGIVNLGTSYAQPNQLFMGSPGSLKFKDMANEAGPGFKLVKVSRGADWGDIDRDGRVDIVVVHLDDWPSLLQNRSDIVGSWISVHLLAPKSKNRAAIGARLDFLFKDGSRIRRQVSGGGGFLGAGDRTLHVAWPKTKELASIDVVWPDRTKETFPAVPPERFYDLVQGSGRPADKAAPKR